MVRRFSCRARRWRCSADADAEARRAGLVVEEEEEEGEEADRPIGSWFEIADWAVELDAQLEAGWEAPLRDCLSSCVADSMASNSLSIPSSRPLTRCWLRESSSCSGARLFATCVLRYGVILAIVQVLTCSSSAAGSR